MTSTVKIKNEQGTEIELTVTRVDQRVTVEAIIAARAGQELPKIRPTRSRRRSLFIVTGKATAAEADALETASKNWWTLGSGATKGRIRFYWDTRNSGNPYDCAITKYDNWKEGGKQKYEYLLELEEGAF